MFCLLPSAQDLKEMQNIILAFKNSGSPDAYLEWASDKVLLALLFLKFVLAARSIGGSQPVSPVRYTDRLQNIAITLCIVIINMTELHFPLAKSV